MTGHMRGGKGAHQKEKIHAMLRANADRGMTATAIRYTCKNSGDPILVDIAQPTIRRCLGELRDMGKAHKNPYNDLWFAGKMEVSAT